MAREKPVETSLWADPLFAQMNTHARLLYLWAITNPACGLAGIYHASVKQMRKAIRADEALLERALESLARRPWLRYHPDDEVLWVVDYAARASSSPKHSVAIFREWERCPPSLLKVAFAERYDGILRASGCV